MEVERDRIAEQSARADNFLSGEIGINSTRTSAPASRTGDHTKKSLGVA